MSGRYRKKPVVIDAVQWDGGNSDVILEFLADGHDDFAHLPNAEGYVKPGVGYSPVTREFDTPACRRNMRATVARDKRRNQ